MKVNPVLFVLYIAISIILGASVSKIESKSCSEKIQQLQMRNAFLEDYKHAYIDLVDKMDTLHQNCFQMNESSMRINNTYTLSDRVGNSTVCCKECNQEITNQNK